MRFVATLIGPVPGSLTEAHVAAARAALASLGAEETPADWLSDGEAADLVFDDLDPDQADAAIRQVLNGAAVDCIAQPVENRRKALLIADMESTIIEQEMLDEIADLKGIKPQIADITARAMNGEIDFVEALNERVSLLAGLGEGEIDSLMRRITFMPGAEALVRTMRRAGARTLLVSGGFTIFAERVAATLGFDIVRANVLEFSGRAGQRVLTGKVVPPVRDRSDKLEQLMQQAGRHRIPLIETIAVGDGANDVPMLQAAGLGVAFHAKPSVRHVVRARIDHAGLLALLFAQGYRLSEIVT
ncbi:MAG TPA: phosphoserine phosphatase SerB [Alphaproteobacteria bacterium]|jgi:phosphoserine phosphatase|nr:phosphoserine phosphatase SerB [Alphaproteobacteria bacterium]